MLQKHPVQLRHWEREDSKETQTGYEDLQGSDGEDSDDREQDSRKA